MFERITVNSFTDCYNGPFENVMVTTTKAPWWLHMWCAETCWRNDNVWRIHWVPRRIFCLRNCIRKSRRKRKTGEHQVSQYDSVEITNKMQPCNRIYYSTVLWQLNMFRAAYRSSSGALTVFAASGLHTHVVTGRSQVKSSWWWAVCRSKHLELSMNGGIINSVTRLHLVGYCYWDCIINIISLV